MFRTTYSLSMKLVASQVPDGPAPKVLIVSTPWYPTPPQAYGGIESVCWNLSRGLADLGCEVTLFGGGQSALDHQGVRRVNSFDLAPSAKMGSSAPEVEHQSALIDLLRSESYDLISDHSLFGAMIGLAADVPTVATAHRIIAGEFEGAYKRLSEQLPLVAISHRQAEIAPKVKVHAVVHNGIDTQAFLPVNVPSRDYLLFLGSMNHQKGVHLAIDAAKRLNRRLIIAAKCQEPHELAYFESHIAPHLSDRISYIGEVGGEKKVALLGNAQALVFPALWEESFGLVMAEALSCGTPVVGFDIGAASEIVDHAKTGFLVRNLDEMVESLGQLDSLDPLHARQVATARFDYRLMARRYHGIFSGEVPGEGPSQKVKSEMH